MDTRNNDFDFDFTPIGQAIKKARTAKGMTREQLARIVDYDPRHLQAIENEGQKPSLELLIQLVTMFGVSMVPSSSIALSSGVTICFLRLTTPGSTTECSPHSLRNAVCTRFFAPLPT